MNGEACVCDPQTVTPSKDFIAKGKVHIFIVLNLRDFTEQNSRQHFERLRGGHAFADVVKGIKPEKYFIFDDSEYQTTKRGHEFQVFRGHLKDDWLYPTYLLQPDRAPAPDDPTLSKDWNNYEYRIRLSRTGFLEVKLTKVIREKGENITTILQKIMEMGHYSNQGFQPRSAQLKLALYCADLFIRNISNMLTIDEPKSGINTTLRLEAIGENPSKLPYRQRYTILFLSELLCQQCGCRVEAEKLRNEYGDTLAAILEGVLVEDENQKLSLPEMDEDIVQLRDLASWKEDLCVFAPERALIYFPKMKIYLSGQTGPDAVKYEHYWECITRGIEHTIVVRAALQIIEYYTTRDLDEVPALTQKVVDGLVTEDDKEEISRMAQAVANTFGLLPSIRDVLVPSSSYRASYAVNKFERLNAVLHLKDIEAHVERNVDELVGFVQFFSSMELQDELNKNEESINRIGLVIALIALLVAGPSFLADYNAFAVQIYDMPPWTEWAFFGALIFFSLYLIFKMTIRKSLKERNPLNIKKSNFFAK